MKYPMKLIAPLKDYLWGGMRLRDEYGKETQLMKVAESWELACHRDGKSVIANGAAAGQTLADWIAVEGQDALGRNAARFSYFPLLIKLIDAHDDLSVQVHPDDNYAMQAEGEYGKTELWYVVDAAAGAELLYGFQHEITKEEFRRRIEEGTLLDVVRRVPVKKGDVFFIPAGTLHAIGKGILICEIQQNSNTTYRIYDYNRKGADGKGRELHTELAKDAIDYTFQSDYRTHYTSQPGAAVELVQCPYFTTRLLETETPMMRDYATLDSFVVYICMAGSVELRDDNGNELTVSQGQTVLFPATTQSVTLKPAPQTKLLETYIA